MGKLTTHVLDTASGRPGQGITVELYRTAPRRELIKTVVTDEMAAMMHHNVVT